MGWRSHRSRRRLVNLGLFGLAPILAGMAILWDAIGRKQRLTLAPPSDVATSMRRMPWEQQLYLIEIIASCGFILAGVLISVVILSPRRG